MMEKLYEHRKECYFFAFKRNFEWSKKTNEIALQIRKWCIAFWLIFFGFLIKEDEATIHWFHFIIGVSGVVFFMSLDVLQQYYEEILSDHRYILNKEMLTLPELDVEVLKNLKPLPIEPVVKWSRLKKIKVYISKVKNETILYFYSGLLLFTVGLLLFFRHY